MTPRKHAELIKAWADGAEIQYYSDDNEWIDSPYPAWLERGIYRIKPVPKADYRLVGRIHFVAPIDSLLVSVTFDGETGEAKKVEIVK